jgi:hypothetical protein
MRTRNLTDEEKDLVVPALVEADVAPRATCRTAAEECRLVQRLPSLLEIRGAKSALAYAALRSRACGITLGDDIFVRAEFFDSNLGLPIRLVAHELAHVVQFRRDGSPAFLARYLRDWQAYLSISYEREARQVAESVAAVPN